MCSKKCHALWRTSGWQTTDTPDAADANGKGYARFHPESKFVVFVFNLNCHMYIWAIYRTWNKKLEMFKTIAYLDGIIYQRELYELETE